LPVDRIDWAIDPDRSSRGVDSGRGLPDPRSVIAGGSTGNRAGRRLGVRGTGTIDQISPYLLWVGHAGDGGDHRPLHDLGIEAVVQLAVEEPPLTPPRGIMYDRFPLGDGSGNPGAVLAMAIGTVVALIRFRVPTLVCCGMGLSRSPAVAAAALAIVRRESPDEALRAVAALHPVDVSPGLWREVRMARPAFLGVGDEGGCRP